VGNEVWDCGGRLDPVTYAREFLRYAALIRHVDPAVELIAVGTEDVGEPGPGIDPEWNVKLLAAMGDSVSLLDHLAVHRYWTHGGPETGFTEADYYNLLDDVDITEGVIERAGRLLAQVSPKRFIGVAMDEWGVWHPEARDWGPGEVPRRMPLTLEQANTMRDALAAAIALEGFHRQCRVLSMANIAQVVNVLQAVILTDGDACVRTPTYHVFALHRPHMGAQAMTVEVQSEPAGPSSRPAISATASSGGAGLAITIVNRDYRRAIPVLIEAPGRVVASRVLAADSADAQNTPAQAGRVAPRPLDAEGSGPGSFTVEMPACSVATIELSTEAAV
jgi:alpha-N-arabinofuranosidase